MSQASNTKNNQLIRRAITRMFPASFASALTLSVHFMADSILAGFFFTPTHIAAIGIGGPVQMLLSSVIMIFSNGMLHRMAACIGRGDGEGNQRAYSTAFLCQIVLSALFTLVMIAFAEPLVGLCGARTPETVALAAKYVRFYAPFMICSTLAGALDHLLGLYGHPEESFKMSCVKMVGNLAFSVLLVKFTDLDIAGLGLGSVLAEAVAAALSFRALRRKKIALKIHPKEFAPRELREIVKLGLPSSCDMLIDSFVMGVVNNIVVSAFGVIALSYNAVVNGIVNFASIASQAAAQTASPLFGLLFGARDKNGMKRAFRDGYLLGLASTAVWGAVILLALPLLLTFYGMDAPEMAEIIRPGVFIGIALIAVHTLDRQFTSFFEATEHFAMALAFSVIADSVLYPLLLPSMLSAWGYTGLWVGKGLCTVLVFALYYLALCLYKRRPLPSTDELLRLSSDLREHAPKLDISLRADNANARGISERIQAFLADSGASKRTAYMAALCAEELAADFVEHMRLDGKSREEIMDVKLFADEDSVSVIIRNDAPPYNPLDFSLDEETFSKMGVALAQKAARKIEYAYIYKMNVVTVVLNR